MNSINFVRRNSFRKNFFPKSIRVPTEFQLNTWENEGGCVYGACDNAVIIDGVLCENMSDKFRVTLRTYWKGLRSLFGSPNK